MSDLDALKACPFCGNTPRLVDLAGFEVICNCGVVLCLDEPDRESVVAAWNRRAELQKPALHELVTDAETDKALQMFNVVGGDNRTRIRRTLSHFLQGRAKPAQEEITDAERLDFVLANGAFIVRTLRDGSIKQVQLFTQDEDEGYHILSGDERYFSTEREAIDIAIRASKGEKT